MADVKILLVEDESIEALDIKRTLESFGYLVPYVASSGEEAINKTVDIMPDLILMDIVLKGNIDGIEAVSKIKELNIPVIYLTAHSEESTIEKAKLTEPYGYIIKPYDHTELRYAIELAIYKNKMEKELKLSESKYHSIFENSMDAVLLTAPNGDILDANPAAERLFGYPMEEICNLGRQGLVDADDDRLSELLKERKSTGKAKGELNFIKSDGTKFTAEISSARFKDLDGNERTSTVIRDITHQKIAEKTLKESEEKFRSLVDNAADILLVHDFNGKIIDTNKRAYESLGYSREELFQMNIMDIEQDIDLKNAQEKVWPKIKPEEPFSLFGHLRRKDGTIFPVDVRFALVDIQGKKLFMGLARDITKHLKMENELKESEKRLFDIIDFLPDATFAIDSQGKVIAWNRAIENMTGFKAEEMMGKGNYEYSLPFYGINRPILIDLVTHSDLYFEERAYDFVERMGEAILAQTEAPLKGVNRILWGKAVPLHDDEGNIKGAIEVIRDITDRKIAEETLKVSEEKYRTLFDTMIQGVVYQDANGHITSMNPAAEKIMGYTLEEIQGGTSDDHIWGSIHENGTDFPGETHPSMVALKTGKEIKNVVMGVKYPTKEGYTWLKINAVPQFRPGEEIPYQVYTTFEDITQRKNAEKDLKVSENKYRTLFDNAVDGILLMKKGCFIECNQKALEIYGATREQLIGKTPYSIFSPEMQPDGGISKDQAIKFINKALDGYPQHFEWKHLHYDGTPFYTEVTLNRLKIEDEYLLQALVRDVTERKKTDDLLRESEQRYRKVGHLISDFAYSCVHGESGSYELDWITDSFYHLTGFNEKELHLNHCWLFTVHPEDEKIAHNQLAGLKAGSKDVRDFRIISSTGEVRWLRNHVECEEDNDLGKLRIYGAAEDITQLKKAGKKLEQSEERFRSLINYSADLIRILDKNGLIIFDSPSSERILGYPEGSLIGKSPLDFIHPDDQERVKNDLEEVYENRNQGIPTEFRIQKADGTYLPVESVSQNMMDVPSIEGIVVTTHPIKERKEMEDVLRESEEKYRSLFEEDPDYTILIEKDGLILDVNNATINLAGLSKKELIGMNFSELEIIPPEDLEFNLEKITCILKGEYIEPFETRFLDKDGNIHLVLVHLTTVMKNENISYILEIASDITERKLAENKLRSSQIQLINAMEMSNLVNWEYDVASDMFTFDDRFYTLYGTTAEREGGYLMSSEVYAREFVHHDDLEMVGDEIDKALKTSNPDYVSQVEHRIIRRDGSIRHLVVKIAITKDAEGQTIKTHGTNQDITELKEKEEEIKKSLQEKEVLLREIHHRVKNNMQILSSLLNLQIQSEDLNETVSVLKESQGRVKSMAMIHEKLYQSPSFTHINFKQYIERLVTDIFYSYLIKTKVIELKLDIDDVNLNIDTAIPLGLIVNELVTNSIMHAFPHLEGTITIKLNQLPEQMELIITDDGVGFPDELDFKNTKTLGLQLVNNLVKQLDGETTIDRSHGTEFKITFKELEYKKRI